MSKVHLPPSISRSDPEKEFDLIKQIGSGTYGEVYKAKVLKTQDICALKIIKIEPGEDFNIILMEITILSECKHKNIVGYFGGYLRRDKLWIAMEYCGGGSLQDIYHVQGGLNELQIAFVCRETLHGLNYLHLQNKMHRDIKGANILLTDDGDVKLADFGIAAQISQTLMKRKSFIGTPYWMAPEVAAVERKGGYNQKCDIWAVGITAIELAEKQPPMFDLHPMRALFLMTKRTFKSPALTHKGRWSEQFHDFLRNALQKEPKRRPTADDLLKHPFVDRELLDGQLMHPLVKVLKAPPGRKSSTTDEEEDKDDQEERQRCEQFRRVPSRKNHHRIHKPDIDAQNLRLQPSVPKDTTEPMAASERSNIRKVPIEKKSSHNLDQDDPVYSKIDNTAIADAPPIPPRSSSRSQIRDNKEVYSQKKEPNGETPPPIPDRTTPEGPPLPPKAKEGPPLPPKPQLSESGRGDPRAYFSKIFNGCPLHLSCAQTWSHPNTGLQYAFLGADEGLYSLQLGDCSDPIMEQVYPRSCHWLAIFNNVLVSISGRNHHLCETNLVMLFDKENSSGQKFGQRNATHKIADSRGCIKCCIARNPYNDQKFLVAAVPKGILLLRWYPPRHIFMMDKLVEYKLEEPLEVFESFVNEAEEYPHVCLGLTNHEGGSVAFETINLNLGSNFYKPPSGSKIRPCTFHQVEENAVLIGYERYVKFVDKQGKLKPSSKQASQLSFDNKGHAFVRLQDCVLCFHKHGMQGKSLTTSQVTAEVTDHSKVFRMLGSHPNIIIETKPADDLNGTSNIYILVSEESN